MIAPDFRACAPNEITPAVKKFVEENHGTDLWEALQPSIVEVDNIKKELSNAPAFKTDVEQLKKFQEIYTKNYQNAMVMNKYFVFGSG